MGSITTGRRLDGDGEPIEGTGFEIETDGRIADLIRDRTGPVISNPVHGEWVVTLAAPDETGGEYFRALAVFPPGNKGPLEHMHIGYDEEMEILSGTFVFDVDGETRRLQEGESLTVESRTPHTWRCVGSELGVAHVETRPAGRLCESLRDLYGLAHEGKLNGDRPPFLQAVAMMDEYGDDQRFTMMPQPILQPLVKLTAPITGLTDYQGTYPKYQDDAFWERHVEQPEL